MPVEVYYGVYSYLWWCKMTPKWMFNGLVYDGFYPPISAVSLFYGSLMFGPHFAWTKTHNCHPCSGLNFDVPCFCCTYLSQSLSITITSIKFPEPFPWVCLFSSSKYAVFHPCWGSKFSTRGFQQLQEGVFLRSTMVWKHVAARTQLWPESYQYGQLEVLNWMWVKMEDLGDHRC